MNLYIHFPFCRRKCSYCALYSRVGSTADARRQYIESIRVELGSIRVNQGSDGVLSPLTIYFGGGSPALCDLTPLRDALHTLLAPIRPYPTLSDPTRPYPTLSDPISPEFTVELHPLDVTPAKLDELKSIGVNRISMGVQSLDDATLRAMGRGYTADDAARAFELVKSRFDNAGIDLIVGYPGDPTTKNAEALLAPLAGWGLRHCSVYSLQNERGLKNVPDDDTVLDGIRAASRFLKSIGLSRYEISNYAAPGFECRHNMAVWRGEDYIGLGDGAYGRIGLSRTRNWWGQTPRNPQKHGGLTPSVETVDEKEDLKERTIFRLRTRDGLDASRFPEWIPTLDRFVADGLLVKPGEGSIYRLTERGAEVCDYILSEIV